MRILIVHRYYWPDKSPCAGIIRWVAKHLAKDGHSIDVISSQPSYRESSQFDRRPRVEHLDGINVHRLSLPTETGSKIWRILNAIYLGYWVFLKSVVRRYDIIIVSTVPPVLGGFFSAVSAKLTRARFIYYCMDLHPEVGRVSGDFANPLLFRLLLKIDDWNCRQANPVLVHSEDMRNTLRARPRGNEYNIQIINNFALPTETNVRSSINFDFDIAKNQLSVIYAGNVGRFQGLETMVDAMSRLTHRKDIELIVMGEGVAKQALLQSKQKTNANIRFLDHQPVEVAKEMIGRADIGLVTLIPEMYRYAYPSKTMAYLERGRPIIAAVETESELARTMEAEGYGFSVPISDASAIAELLVKLADDDSWKSVMNDAALKAFQKHFSAPVVLAKWSEVVRSTRVVEITNK